MVRGVGDVVGAGVVGGVVGAGMNTKQKLQQFSWQTNIYGRFPGLISLMHLLVDKSDNVLY